MRFTLGPQGAAVTSRIPGTGIAFRQSLTSHTADSSGDSSAVPSDDPAPPTPAAIEPSPSQLPRVEPPTALPVTDDGAIRSAGTSEVSSPGLEQFREMLTKAHQERLSLLPELADAVSHAAELAERQKNWEQGWLFRRIAPGRFARIKAEAAEAEARRDELQEQEKLSRLQTQIDIPENLRKAFSQASDAFALVARSERQWDTISRVATDRVRERTTASQTIRRTPVRFDLGSCDLIQSEWKVPHLPNANGGDLYLYPGFILLFISTDAFALVDSTEVEVSTTILPFIEEEDVPSDARVLRQEWKKANKDGTPDRRFAENTQVPVVEYASLKITSAQGLNEEYLLSNSAAAEQFASLWGAFKRMLTSVAT